MSKPVKEAHEAFSAQSAGFDKQYRSSAVVTYKRGRIRGLLEKHLEPQSYILELNAGTGEDAIYLAQRGHKVLATDASEGMIGQLRQKVKAENLEDKIEVLQLSFLQLEELDLKQFDAIYSNFGGLNCTDRLDKVLAPIDKNCKPDTLVCLTIMPPNSCYEWLWAFRGKFNQAFRRWKKGGTPSHIEGVHFLSWYYRPSYIRKKLKSFRQVALEGLCMVAPPEPFAKYFLKRKKLLKSLQTLERLVKTWPIFRVLGDYYIILLRKRD